MRDSHVRVLGLAGFGLDSEKLLVTATSTVTTTTMTKGSRFWGVGVTKSLFTLGLELRVAMGFEVEG